MRKTMMALCAVSAIALATPATPAFAGPEVVTVDDTTSGKPLTDTIHASQATTPEGLANNAVQVYGSTAQDHMTTDVKYTGGTAFLSSEGAALGAGGIGAGINITENGGGFASIKDSTIADSNAFMSLIINPDQAFTDMKFAVQLTGAGSFDVFYLLQGGTQFLNGDAPYTFFTDNKGNTNYLVDVTGGIFDAIQIRVNQNPTSLLSAAAIPQASIFEMKQVSINEAVPAVPEPATWALMLLGFGGIGAAMRHQRKNAKGGSLLRLAQIA